MYSISEKKFTSFQCYKIMIVFLMTKNENNFISYIMVLYRFDARLQQMIALAGWWRIAAVASMRRQMLSSCEFVHRTIAGERGEPHLSPSSVQESASLGIGRIGLETSSIKDWICSYS